MKLKNIAGLVCLTVFTLMIGKAIAGFDAGGGAKLVMNYLESSASKNRVESVFVKNHDEESITLATSQKFSADDEESWKNIMQGEEKYIVLEITFGNSNERPIFLVFKFENYEVVGEGELVLNLEDTEVYNLDVNHRELHRINYFNFMSGLCLNNHCPNMHFVAPGGQD